MSLINFCDSSRTTPYSLFAGFIKSVIKCSDQVRLPSPIFLAIYLQGALRSFKFGGLITPRRINSYKFYRIVCYDIACISQLNIIGYHRVSSGESSIVPGESQSGEQAFGRNIRIPFLIIVRVNSPCFAVIFAVTSGSL